MQELLSKTADAKSPLRDQEFFELNFSDIPNPSGTLYIVRQAHAQWSDVDGEIMWDLEEVEHFSVLSAAKQRYDERRRALAERGFIYSDLDPIF